MHGHKNLSEAAYNILQCLSVQLESPVIMLTSVSAIPEKDNSAVDLDCVNGHQQLSGVEANCPNVHLKCILLQAQLVNVTKGHVLVD